jgi:hypothetical protein
MSNRYKGAVISATPPTTTGGEDGTASGAWTLEQQMQLQAAGLWPAQPTGPYIEQVFSTYLYTGNGSTQAINNGINLSGKGGLVWIKNRNSTQNHYLITSPDSTGYELSSNDTGGGGSLSGSSWLFTNTGFSFDAPGFPPIGTNGNTYASWTFRKQPKFFDVVSFTYPLSGSITVPHNLASTPGCVMLKVTDGVDNWYVYHRMANNGTNPSNYILQLNTTSAQINNFASWITVGSSSITFPSGALNPGSNFVMYLFAHDAGGFGLSGTENVITCGGVTPDGSGDFSVNLGYEPQWVLTKTTGASRWNIFDNMRGVTASSGYTSSQRLQPQASDAEDTLDSPYGLGVSAIGFTGNTATFATPIIYIAIRRGPMKVPTVGTSVFTPTTRAGTGASVTTSNLSFPPDMVWSKGRDNGGTNSGDFDRLRGVTKQLSLNQSDSETTASTSLTGFDVMTGYRAGDDAVQLTINATGYNYANWNFRRAPGFFDEVCYTGTGSTTTQTHNLGVVPEMMIFKSRSFGSGWRIYSPAGNASKALDFTNGALANNGTYLDGVSPTASVFTIGGAGGGTNNSAETYVAYLFATCAGVSKVGSYTGTATTLQIDCGFTAGARFVLIKRTDSTGDWYVWDSARGIVAGNDPYLLLNSTAAEVTNTDYVDTYNAGFEISSTAPAGINASAGTYIFLAIA